MESSHHDILGIKQEDMTGNVPSQSLPQQEPQHQHVDAIDPHIGHTPYYGRPGYHHHYPPPPPHNHHQQQHHQPHHQYQQQHHHPLMPPQHHQQQEQQHHHHHHHQQQQQNQQHHFQPQSVQEHQQHHQPLHQNQYTPQQPQHALQYPPPQQHQHQQNHQHHHQQRQQQQLQQQSQPQPQYTHYGHWNTQGGSEKEGWSSGDVGSGVQNVECTDADIIISIGLEHSRTRKANLEYQRLLLANSVLFGSLPTHGQGVHAQHIYHFLTHVRGRRFLQCVGPHTYVPFSNGAYQIAQEIMGDACKMAFQSRNPLWIFDGLRSFTSSTDPPTEVCWVHRLDPKGDHWRMVTIDEVKQILRDEGPVNLLILPKGIGVQSSLEDQKQPNTPVAGGANESNVKYEETNDLTHHEHTPSQPSHFEAHEEKQALTNDRDGLITNFEVGAGGSQSEGNGGSQNLVEQARISGEERLPHEGKETSFAENSMGYGHHEAYQFGEGRSNLFEEAGGLGEGTPNEGRRSAEDTIAGVSDGERSALDQNIMEATEQTVADVGFGDLGATAQPGYDAKLGHESEMVEGLGMPSDRTVSANELESPQTIFNGEQAPGNYNAEQNNDGLKRYYEDSSAPDQAGIDEGAETKRMRT